MKMLHLVMILILLYDVLTQISGDSVTYPNEPVCAVRGFSASIPCSYDYEKNDLNIKVIQTIWCSMNTNTEKCKSPPYVYDSKYNNNSDFEYAGDDTSDCTLLIHNVQFSYSGEYKFRFITNVDRIKYTGDPGVRLQVTEVSLIRLSGNGTLKHGDSLNLTCDVKCTHSSSQFVWFKNNQLLNTSGPVLHFPAVTLRDSGNYTCTWKTDTTSGSETISLHVEDYNPEAPGAPVAPAQQSAWVKVLVTADVILIVSLFFILGAVIHNRRSVRIKQQKEDDSEIYAIDRQKKDDFEVYQNVQKKKDDCEIYANV